MTRRPDPRVPALCRACLHRFEAPSARVRCPACGGPRVTAHAELWDLSIAHVDCDAFYAAVEKRDRPDLADKPVIIGGGRRGVVSTACYVARLRGVRSAMPMFRALQLCPDAVVLKGRMSLYVEVSQAIRAMMDALTPAVEPLSLDEAFLDLGGTERTHGAPPAAILARLTRDMRESLGITASVGLSHNKFLAKIASDLDKPSGFSVVGRAETDAFLVDRPASAIWGVGPATLQSLDRAGIRTIRDLRRWDRRALADRFGAMGDRLWHLARGLDARPVRPDRIPKSIGKETTFSENTRDADILDGHLWRLAEQVSARAKAKDMAGATVTLKLKRADFRLVTRRAALREPTQMADRIYRAARDLLDAFGRTGELRLIGVAISDLAPAAAADRAGDLLDPDADRRAVAERATDAIRARYGDGAILKGRALR